MILELLFGAVFIKHIKLYEVECQILKQSIKSNQIPPFVYDMGVAGDQGRHYDTGGQKKK